MIYYAPRSSESYFRSLGDVRTLDHPHVLVSVAGGLGFLNAIGPQVKRVCVFDTDPEAIEYTRLILKAIEEIDTLKEFAELLTGHEYRIQADGWSLGSPVDQGRRARELFVDIKDYMYFMRTIGRMKVQSDLNLATIDDSTILFKGNELTPMTFSWRFGEGVFEDETSYHLMKESISNAQLVVETRALESLDLIELSNGLPISYLVSNLESPLFTRGDKIFRMLMSTALDVPIRYVSWVRNFSILPVTKWREWVSQLLTPLITGNFVSGLNFRPHEDERKLMAGFAPHATIRELHERQVYGKSLLIIDVDGLGASFSPQDDLPKAVAPFYLSIVTFGTGKGVDFLARSDVVEMLTSYTVSLLDQFHNRFFIRFELRGKKSP